MKIEVEMSRVDLVFAAVMLVVLALPPLYFIHRDTAIRQSLVDQAKASNYGDGLNESVKKRARSHVYRVE